MELVDKAQNYFSDFKPESGTQSGHFRLVARHAAGVPYGDQEFQTHYLGGLIENARRQGVGIGVLLLDREFNSMADAPEAGDQRVLCNMPKSGDLRVCRAIEEAEADPGKACRVALYERVPHTGFEITLRTNSPKIRRVCP